MLSERQRGVNAVKIWFAGGAGCTHYLRQIRTLSAVAVAIDVPDGQGRAATTDAPREDVEKVGLEGDEVVDDDERDCTGGCDK